MSVSTCGGLIHGGGLYTAGLYSEVYGLETCLAYFYRLCHWYFSVFRFLVVWVTSTICQQRDIIEMQGSPRFMKERVKFKDWS